MEIEEDNILETRFLRCVCLGGVASLGALVALVAALAITGSIIAVESRQAYPATEAAAEAAARTFSCWSAWHNALSILLLFPLLSLVAFSILFSLNIGGFDAKRTKRPWAQTVLAGTLGLCVIASLVLGNVYASRMALVNHWLLAPPGGYAPDTVVMEAPATSAGSFSTFVTFHSIILPMLAVMIIAFMWPPFCEFTKRPEADTQQKSTLTFKRDLRL